MPGAVSGTAARKIRVNRVVAVCGGTRHLLAYLCEDGRYLLSAAGRAGIDHVSYRRDAGSDLLAIRAGVLIGGAGVIRAAKPAVPRIHAGHLVAGVAGPRCSPEDRLGNDVGHDRATVPSH